MPTNYITLTRQELYDMVWATPMSSLAKDFGISDVALAKRCRAVDVPIPYRGYWARKTAGQEPPRGSPPQILHSSASRGSRIRSCKAANLNRVARPWPRRAAGNRRRASEP